MKRLCFVFIGIAALCFPSSAGAQAWSGILDPSRAWDWTSGVGFSIPSYSVNCATQPSLTAGSGNAGANATAIASAISSCDATHNVVNIPSGTYYTAGIQYGGKSNVVVRGAGANSTYLFDTVPSGGCGGYPAAGVCMAGNSIYAQSTAVNPGAGNNVCSWTAGYAQGSSSITLGSCGNGAPPVGTILVLDQKDEGADNGGYVPCSSFDAAWNCTQKGNISANAAGRVIGGIQYSQQQNTIVQSVSGSGPYTVTISPGVYFNNIRTGQTPGAWWASTNMTLAGLENLTIDHSTDTSTNIGGLMIWCKDCWVQGVRSISAITNHIDSISDFAPVIQNNYLYGSQHAGSSSYAVEMLEVSGGLVQNNIIQNTTSPDIKDAVSGSVTAYNFTPYINFGNYMQGMYASHNSGSAFNLLEGNATTEFLADDVWGTSFNITMFRNQAVGWQPTYVQQTYPISINTYDRGFNIIGNILGEPGYHTQYEAYATSPTAGVHRITHGGSTSGGPGTVNQSIYEIGWTDTAGLGVCTNPPGSSSVLGATNDGCDALSWTTMMRWKNYDTVNGAVISDTTEASPGAVPYIAANPAPTSPLPSSFYLTGKPSWFGSLTYPSYGPDVTSGTTGICTSGTFNGLWVTNSGQCGGGGFTAHAWAGHANANPAQNCYLNVMNGPPDGSGTVLAFNPITCYAGSSPTLVSIAVTPTTPTVTVGNTQAFIATGTYSDSSTSNITSTVTWVSSNTSHATINSSGLATGVGAGNTNITASLSSITSNTAVLTVTAATLVSIAITPTSPSIIVGNTQAFVAIGTYSDSSTANITSLATWNSASSGVATINSSGVATGVGSGTSAITATMSAVTSNTATLTVSAATLVSIAVTPISASIAVSGTQAFTAIGTYNNTATADITTSVTWASSSTGVATIASSGVATGVTAGSSTISCSLSVVTSNSATLAVTAIPTATGFGPLIIF